MSKVGLASLLIAALCMTIVVIARFILGGWLDMLWFPLGMGLVSFAALLATEFRTILDFLTMRTTKNGMNMGVIIALMIVVLASVNYLSIRHNKTFDLTEEKINSLSEQTLGLLAKLDQDIFVHVFYKGEEAAQPREQLRQILAVYSESSSKVKVRFYNTFTENAMTQTYVNDLPDNARENLFAFVEYNGKRIRVQAPLMTEEKITSALIKATRQGTKTIYFLVNHGEPTLDLEEGNGLTGLKKALEDSSFQVKPLDLISTPKVPDDAAVVAIVGSTTPLLDGELDLLRSYARAGGRLLIAADPGQRHNLSLLTRTLGVEFKNNYVLSPISQLMGRSMASSVGVTYDETSEITNKFHGNMTVFDLVSEVTVAPDGPEGLQSVELVKTHESSFAASELKNVQRSEQRPFVVAVSVSGSLAGKKPDSPESAGDTSGEFAAVVVGDSDFLTNKGLINGLNRDLALNSLTYLAKEADLVTIRPKQMNGTELIMTTTTQKTVVLAGLALPLFLLAMSGVLWFRRRSS
jgi:ABC-type uncharacterized transport system involved in gliding motility auxiliary subunit